MNQIVFIDAEINPQTKEILDLGAIDFNRHQFHSTSKREFTDQIAPYEYIAGHNIINHDMKYLKNIVRNVGDINYIDTLYLSALLFPTRPYHALLKDDKLQSESLSNPLNDAIKAMELFCDEIDAFKDLDILMQKIFIFLLKDQEEFKGFFKYLDYYASIDCEEVIRKHFKNKICDNVDLKNIISEHPVELAYCLTIINADDKESITPPWINKTYPIVEYYMRIIRNKPCDEGCEYCAKMLDVKFKLKEVFGYDEFRRYNGEPLQEQAADAAVHNKSLLAIFPTGGGKSITFQLPAIMAGETAKGLTVIISPLQSLMKDQVDNLIALGIYDAVTVNGMLSPIERQDALERVLDGRANILYISPESLRSRTIEKILISRNVVRFVIDEAHCFSSWGQDFRVDYLYIGDFIRELQKKKNINYQIPISCFTATAKQKVVSDIRDYFKEKLNLELELYVTSATRTNLRYEVLYRANDDDKYTTLRDLIAHKKCPTIIYVSRTKRTFEIARKLSEDGWIARPFNGKMDSREKIENQEAFINGEVQVIVATSAFGMGVDKKDVKLVVHYDISDSLENYVQEAGRAGRDSSLQAECYVLFNENDLDKHFMLLNQTKLSLSEIQQVWRAVKDLTKSRPFVCCSPLEVARQAGWDESVNEVETRVKTAISALETTGYIKRGNNIPKVYATSILAKDMIEASNIIRKSNRFSKEDADNASRIIKMMISSRSIANAQEDEAESRVDYISDILGIPKDKVIKLIALMREEKLLDDDEDMTAYIKYNDTENKSMNILNKFTELEKFLFDYISDGMHYINLKEINDDAERAGIKGTTVKKIKMILYYWTIKGYIQKVNNVSGRDINIVPKIELELLNEKYDKRVAIAKFIVEFLYSKVSGLAVTNKEENLVQFSVLELQKAYIDEPSFIDNKNTSFRDIHSALLYLSKIEALQLEGGFLVLYNGMDIRRLEMDNRIKYKIDDYKQLDEFYKQKIQQIHIVGEYANMMVKSYEDALQFVNDYFQMEYKFFLSKYFKGNRLGEINRNITPGKSRQLFDCLSEKQREIIDDDDSKYIVVAAGPGSGKTRVLVHKLAALLMLEDVKHEQLLMLTFSRAAATEFKQRLVELIGNAACFVEIKTFHSYCFDLLGKMGNLEQSGNIVRDAAEMIRSGEVEAGRITKAVVVIDEAQDMDKSEYSLIEALIDYNDDMRVIAVGDDDQNIYEFRGSSSKHLRSFIEDKKATKYNLLDNYRSCKNIVSLANDFVQTISGRLKTQSIHSMGNEQGKVEFIKHISEHLEYPIVKHIQDNNINGTKCILTSTNDEALKLVGLLNKEGISTKLIQSDDAFNLYNLVELRMFIKYIIEDIETPIISDEKWQIAIEKIKLRYAGSTCLDLCLDLINGFASINKKKYKSDLINFIKESQFDDFITANENEIIVSTIHKSKGREFDRVYMFLNNVCLKSDEEKRKIYVGITRAKKELFIHYNNDVFDEFTTNVIVDGESYPEPNEIKLQLSHRDVYLDYFNNADRKNYILKNLKSGSILKINEKFVYGGFKDDKEPIAILSNSAKENINLFIRKGYKVNEIKVRFIVARRCEENNSESAVILFDIYLKR